MKKNSYIFLVYIFCKYESIENVNIIIVMIA